jgi:BirA family biotin operon repressor/biotin-[acetyl-CoA-carboxylase] ligase
MLPRKLLERLADGHALRLADLAADCGCDEKALAADIAALREPGVVRLAEPINWINAADVRAALGPEALAVVAAIGCDFELESTNRALLEAGPPAPGRVHLSLAEYQHGGRGRRGRRWTMPPGTGLALSAAWFFPTAPAALSTLSLAVGAAARRAIRDVAGVGIGLKWPNDLVIAGRKLGGILVEVDALPDGARHVVVGIGINVAAPAGYLLRVSDFQHGACDLRSALSGAAPDRSLLAGALANRLVEMFVDFSATGFEPYRAEWLAAHVLDGEAIALTTAAGVDYGTVCGLDADGALLVADASGERRRVLAGDVTVRAGH